MYGLIRTLLVATFLFSLQTVGALAKPESRLPNIIVILADDLGHGDVSYYNPDSKIPTPNIDRLAASGLRLTDAHTPSGVCTPTRYGLLTGRYCWRTWMKDRVLTGFDSPLIEPGRMTLAGLLRKHGYATACVGKWHVGMTFTMEDGSLVPPETRFDQSRLAQFEVKIDPRAAVQGGPVDCGFDYFFGTAACPTTDFLYAYIENRNLVEPILEKYVCPEKGVFERRRSAWKSPGFEFEQVDLVFLNKSIQFIERQVAKNSDQPFFLYHAMQAVHLPALPARQFQGKTGLGPLGDFIAEADWVVGRLVETVERLGQAENTLIIFTSDNGPETCYQILKREYGHDSAAPLRGWKRHNWEGGHRVPFVARWDGEIRPGSSESGLFCLTDLMATFAGIVGDRLPPNAGEDSWNLLPLLRGQASEATQRGAVVHHSRAGLFAIREGRWKALFHQGSGDSLNEDQSGPPGQLYDMRSDLAEAENLYGAHPDIVQRLSALLEKFQAEGRSAPLSQE